MIPFQKMQHHYAQSAFEPVVFFLARVVDLLGDRDRIDFRELTGAQKVGLTHGPRIKVSAFRRRRSAPSEPHFGPSRSPKASAQSDVERALRQFLAKAALVELGDQGSLELVAFVEEGQAEGEADVLEDL